MKIFLDTEFTSLMHPSLISIGLVTEDGQEFYMERNDYNRKESSSFVREAVEPFLFTNGHSFNEISARLYCWLEDLPGNHIIIVDYYTDWELLIDLIENIPQNLSSKPEMLTEYIGSFEKSISDEKYHDARFILFDSIEKYYDVNKLHRHHALNDAKANRYGWIKAMEYLNGL